MMDYDLRHGRTYLYLKQKPLYVFGYGLSYTTFRYANLHVSSDHLSPGEQVSISVDVTNTGNVAGDEVVQLYVSHLGSKVDRPIRELKGFQRIPLAAGQTGPVTFVLKPEDLAFWNDAEHRFTLETDRIELGVGGSSDNIQLRHVISADRAY